MAARKRLAPTLVVARNTLLELTSALGQALTARQVAAVILDHCISLSHAELAAVVRREEGSAQLDLLAVHGPKAQCLRLVHGESRQASPVAEVLREGQGLFLEGARTLTRRYPGLEPIFMEAGLCGLIALPFFTEGQAQGAVVLGLTEPIDKSLQEEFAVVAQLCAQSLERARLFEAERAARQAAEYAALRMERLQELTAACSKALAPEEVATAVLTQGRAALNAVSGAVTLVDARGQRLELVGSQGLAAEPLAHMRRLSLLSSHPLVEAVRHRAPVWLGLASEARVRFSSFNVHDDREQAWAALPLVQGEKVIGAVLLAFETPRAFTHDERTFAETLAHHAAQALERIRLTTERARLAEAAAGRGEFLASASASFSASLDMDTTLERLVKVSVPALGDFCFVDMLDAGGDSVRRFSSHLHPAKQTLLEEQGRCGPGTPTSAFGVGQVLASASAYFAHDVAPALRASWARSAEESSLLEVLDPRSVVAVPVRVRGKVLAVLVCAHADSGRRHRREDVALIEDLAHRAGLALDNGMLYGEAQKAVRIREEFLSVAAHELRTPLTALTLTLGALQRETAQQRETASTTPTPPPEFKLDAAAVHSRAARAMRHLHRLSRLVEELLDASSLEHAPLVLERERIDLAALVRGVVERHQNELEQSRCHLTLHAPTPVIGSVDPSRMEQVVTHLLANAMKYAAGTEIQLSVEPFGKPGEPPAARLTIQDGGMGIPESDQLRVFGRFERAVSSDNFGGLGMGLWHVRRVLEAHGGNVRLESPPGGGTLLTAELPLSHRS